MTLVLEPSIQSLPKEIARKTMSENGRNPTPTSYGVPLPTSTINVGEGLRTRGGNPTARWSTTPYMSIGTTNGTMGAFPVKLSTTYQSQRKLRPSNFKKLVEKFDGTKDPCNHMANIKQVIRAKKVNKRHTQFEGFGMTLNAN